MPDEWVNIVREGVPIAASRAISTIDSPVLGFAYGALARDAARVMYFVSPALQDGSFEKSLAKWQQRTDAMSAGSSLPLMCVNVRTDDWHVTQDPGEAQFNLNIIDPVWLARRLRDMDDEIQRLTGDQIQRVLTLPVATDNQLGLPDTANLLLACRQEGFQPDAIWAPPSSYLEKLDGALFSGSVPVISGRPKGATIVGTDAYVPSNEDVKKIFAATDRTRWLRSDEAHVMRDAFQHSLNTLSRSSSPKHAEQAAAIAQTWGGGNLPEHIAPLWVDPGKGFALYYPAEVHRGLGIYITSLAPASLSGDLKTNKSPVARPHTINFYDAAPVDEILKAFETVGDQSSLTIVCDHSSAISDAAQAVLKLAEIPNGGKNLRFVLNKLPSDAVAIELLKAVAERHQQSEAQRNLPRSQRNDLPEVVFDNRTPSSQPGLPSKRTAMRPTSQEKLSRKPPQSPTSRTSYNPYK